MFKKPKTTFTNEPTLHQLTNKLGIERRLALRVKYPSPAGSRLPKVYYGDHRIQILDLSIGGCCLFDPQDITGSLVGVKDHLTLKWPNGLTDQVQIRIVARVDKRVHIQFLTLKPERVEQIKHLISAGARAQWIKPLTSERDPSIHLLAQELWTSPYGDTLTVHGRSILAEITLQGATYTLYKDAWPTKGDQVKLSPHEISELTLFVHNIPQPSDWVKAVSTHLSLLLPEVHE